MIESGAVMLYNPNVDDLLRILSGAQIVRLAKMLRLIMSIGHGSVYIRAKNGKLRYIGLAEVEEEFGLDMVGGALDELIK